MIVRMKSFLLCCLLFLLALPSLKKCRYQSVPVLSVPLKFLFQIRFLPFCEAPEALLFPLVPLGAELLFVVFAPEPLLFRAFLISILADGSFGILLLAALELLFSISMPLGPCGCIHN